MINKKNFITADQAKDMTKISSKKIEEKHIKEQIEKIEEGILDAIEKGHYSYDYEGGNLYQETIRFFYDLGYEVIKTSYETKGCYVPIYHTKWSISWENKKIKSNGNIAQER